MPTPASAPRADPALSALALLRSVESAPEHAAAEIDLMLRNTDVRTLLAGMLDVAVLAATIAGRATQTTRQEVFDFIRQEALDMIASGQLSSGVEGRDHSMGEVNLGGEIHP